MFRTDIPENDAQSYIHYTEARPCEINTEICEVCSCQKEDCRVALDGVSVWKGKEVKCYVCPECLKNGDATKFYLDNGHSKEKVSNWLESLKIK